MTHDEIMNLTPDELRIKVAEKKLAKIDPVFIDEDPPDLSDPTEYMKLMTEIWGKDKNIQLTGHSINYVFPGNKYYGSNFYNEGELWQAIAKAWLIVVGEREEE